MEITRVFMCELPFILNLPNGTYDGPTLGNHLFEVIPFVGTKPVDIGRGRPVRPGCAMNPVPRPGDVFYVSDLFFPGLGEYQTARSRSFGVLAWA